VRESDYLICYQCGFILRLFAIRASERVDVASTAEGRQVVHRLLTAPDGPGKKMAPEKIEGLRDQLFAARHDHAPAQRQPRGAEPAPEKNRSERSLPIQRLNERRLRRVLGAGFSDPPLTVPYKAAGVLKAGQELLSLLDQIADDPTGKETARARARRAIIGTISR
jgi:hypothetical protein